MKNVPTNPFICISLIKDVVRPTDNQCRPAPRIVSEISWGNFRADRALSDGRCDVRVDWRFSNYWHGMANTTSGFVIDLGFPFKIRRILLRNSHNAFYYNT